MLLDHVDKVPNGRARRRHESKALAAIFEHISAEPDLPENISKLPIFGERYRFHRQLVSGADICARGIARL
jgi:hypothetical protein